MPSPQAGCSIIVKTCAPIRKPTKTGANCIPKCYTDSNGTVVDLEEGHCLLVVLGLSKTTCMVQRCIHTHPLIVAPGCAQTGNVHLPFERRFRMQEETLCMSTASLWSHESSEWLYRLCTGQLQVVTMICITMTLNVNWNIVRTCVGA